MRKNLFAVACTLAVLLVSASAQAEIAFKSTIGTEGALAGQISGPAGLAVRTSTGDLYVADRNNNRVVQFTAAGVFVQMWGYDVVTSGTDNKANVNEVNEVRIRATSGSFGLVFKGEETAQISYNASAATVQGALNALPAINAGGGSVTVTGGPGNATGSTPYVVTFSGIPLARTNVELGIEPSGLGLPAGTQLSCEGVPGSGKNQDGFTYQWLANGEPVPGATETTFTPGASEEGKAIQCRVTAGFGAAKTMAASRPYQLASPVSATLPPLGPASLTQPGGKPVLESLGGNALTCAAGSWKRSPETFTYRWYRNGVEIGSPTTTAALTDEYTLSEGDVATRAAFQCSATGNNAGGSSTAISDFVPTDPEPIEPKAENVGASASIIPSATSKVLTRTNGGAVLEVCKPNPPTTDVCKAGVAGDGFGQLNKPRSIAVDNSPGGNGAVYVMDEANPRVQKFSAAGVAILEVGGEVDQTSEANVCTVASGHACGPGVLDKSAASGAFGGVPFAGPGNANQQFAELGNQLAVDDAGHLYVGDARANGDLIQARIEKFDASGNFVSQAKMPGTLGGSRPRPVAITADSAERAFASIQGEQSAIERFSPSEFNLAGDGAHRPGNVFDENQAPAQLAVDPRNDRLLVSDRNKTEKNPACGVGSSISNRAIVEFDANQNKIDCTVPAGPAALPQVTGLAVSEAGLLYAAVGSANTIKVFELPTPAAPQISASSASNITTEAATLHGQINPGFEDTNYSVEYGLEDCEVSSCETVAGGIVRGLEFTDGATPIFSLEPNTTYHYRVIAENSLGTVIGPDRTFTTFPLVDLVNDPCPNALARKQTKTVGLLDCRAYELASAAFAGGYDVESNLVPGQEPHQGFPEAQGKLLYGVHEGGIPGTGNPTNRGLDPYVATRNEDGTWSTEYRGIPSDNPFALSPFSSTLSGADSSLDTLAFAGEICNPCFADGSSGLPVRLPNGELVQGMTGSEPDPTAEPAGYVAKPLSADGSHLVFGTDAKLEPTANENGDATLYSRDLGTETTEVVSTDEAGNTLSGTEVGALDVSEDGSRTLVGAEVSTDGAGNPLWHLYLHREGVSESTDLMPSATEGAYFDGMTEDGSRVFFTTAEELLPEDTDESADVYEAQLDEEGNLALRLVSTLSTGTPSNDDTCTPANEPATWNTPSGNGKCGALAFAGGAGLASSSGDFYFLSPERLEGSEGTQDQPNLYVVEADGNPQFVATIDTSEGKPGPKPPTHPLANAKFAGEEFEAVTALTVDQSNGDLYAIDAGKGRVYRFDSAGVPKDFSAGPHTDNALTGFSFDAFSGAQVAVDNKSAGVLAGAIYLASASGVKVFAPSGEQLGSLDGSSTSQGAWTNKACGAAVDQSSGTLYVADKRGYVWQYTPASPTAPLTDADYTVKGIKPQSMTACALAVDGAGHLYAAKYSEGPVKRFAVSSFEVSTPTLAGTEIDGSAKALAVDPSTNDLYVDEGNIVSVFDSAGEPVASIGQGKLNCGFLGSRGVAVNAASHHVYASCFEPSVIKEFGYELPPYTPVDNPAILGAAHPLTHNWGDFQVTPEGTYAAFVSLRPLKAGYDNASHYEVYRYGGDELLCASCDPTGSQAQSDSVLPPDGLGLLEDGRVFFNTGEQLTLSDTNGKLDAYEYSPQREGVGGCTLPQGCRQLISTGTSAHPSGLLGVSSDGADAFFFTRDELVGEDRNGQAMKVYDARTAGGHFVIPPPPPCAASDECHGAGTQTPPPPQIGTFQGSGGQYTEEAAPPKRCKKPKVRRKGRCVKPRRHKARHRKAAHKRGQR